MSLAPSKNGNQAGYALLLVMIFLAVSLLLLCGTLTWSSGNARLVKRNNQYFNNGFAAEVATEKVIASIAQDYQTNGETWVYANLNNYRSLVPTAAENSIWTNYQFNDAQGNVNKTYVTRLTGPGYVDIETKYAGLRGNSATYQIISNARAVAPDSSNIVSAVKQEIQLASIPIFQFGIFYAIDLEVCPGANMNVTGRTHSNGSIYLQPSGNLTFQTHVTAAQQILHTKSANDPVQRTFGSVAYQGEHDGRVKSFTLPIGTNNNPAALHNIIEIPPTTEATNSLMGQQRYYNKADLIILVYDTGVDVFSGSYNGFATVIYSTTNSAPAGSGNGKAKGKAKKSGVTPTGSTVPFLSTTNSFKDLRQSIWIQSADFDISQFNIQYATLAGKLGHNPTNIYIADLRTTSTLTNSGVRVVNGQVLTNGLTIATPNPLYVKGHYNVPTSSLGTTNTSATKPASLVADAITFLSPNWSDASSSLALSSRTATNMTVNAAIIAGIVPSGGGYYSGGVENMIRLLENWSGKTLTYNGSLVALYTSQDATAPWGASSAVYLTPTRNMNFDPNFMSAGTLPPGTPELRATFRGQWIAIQANSLQ